MVGMRNGFNGLVQCVGLGNVMNIFNLNNFSFFIFYLKNNIILLLFRVVNLILYKIFTYNCIQNKKNI